MKFKSILPLALAAVAALALQVHAHAKPVFHEPKENAGDNGGPNASSSLQALALAEDGKSPFTLRFRAADGSPVDLSTLRGHVVLIDFWATWCPPCMRELPNVVAAYRKYHDQGFDVIGVSLDADKEAMLSVTQSHGMPWPQYFDGLGWENRLTTSLGIQSIPTMWLVNKEGMLVNTDARGNLEPEVAKLLAE